MARVLVIDDDEAFRTMVEVALKRAGHETWHASDGEEGIRIFRTIPVDLVITDIIMPEKEGIETVLELRRSDPDVAIIAVSGGGRIEPQNYLCLAEKLGADETFSKPLCLRTLRSCVQRLTTKPASAAGFRRLPRPAGERPAE